MHACMHVYKSLSKGQLHSQRATILKKWNEKQQKEVRVKKKKNPQFEYFGKQGGCPSSGPIACRPLKPPGNISYSQDDPRLPHQALHNSSGTS